MKHLYTARLFGILAILLLLNFSGCTSKPKAIDAPDFTLKSITGEDITLSNYRGKVVLLDFWATWCGPCMQSTPELVRLQEKYRDKGLVILGISMDTPYQADDDQLKKFMQTFGIKYPIMRDNGVVSRVYFGHSPAAIPTMHIINREGKIVKTIIGFAPGEVEKSIKNIL